MGAAVTPYQLRQGVFRRRRRSKQIINSYHIGFAGVHPPEMHPPPASIRSPELGYPAQDCLPMSALLIGGGVFLRAEAFPQEENIQKDNHLRPRRLRRTTVARKSPSSGEHSLAGTEIAGTVRFSGEDSPPGRGCSAGGKHIKRSSPPTTAASPEFGRPPSIHLRRAFSPRRWATRHHNQFQ